jgi:hypothetical protein
MTDRGLFLARTPFITNELVNSLGGTKFSGSLLHQPCFSPDFETLPRHSIPWHPSPTQHCRANCAALVFFSCRVARSLAPSPLHLAWLLLLGHTLPPVYHPGHGDVTSPLHRGHGHGATLVTSLGPGRHGPRANHLLLPRRDCLPTRLPQRDRPGRNASPRIWSYHRPAPLGDRSRKGGHARLGPTWFP